MLVSTSKEQRRHGLGISSSQESSSSEQKTVKGKARARSCNVMLFNVVWRKNEIIIVKRLRGNNNDDDDDVSEGVGVVFFVKWYETGSLSADKLSSTRFLQNTTSHSPLSTHTFGLRGETRNHENVTFSFFIPHNNFLVACGACRHTRTFERVHGLLNCACLRRSRPEMLNNYASSFQQRFSHLAPHSVNHLSDPLQLAILYHVKEYPHWQLRLRQAKNCRQFKNRQVDKWLKIRQGQIMGVG